MATLQKIRSTGPLLVIIIGLALFAFIAGDAWKVLQPQQSRDVGEVNGKALSAQDFQSMVDEYTEVIKLTSGQTSLNDDQNNQIKDEVWRSYVNNKLIEKQAKKLGLEVSNAELQSIINEGTYPLLQQTPFRNPQTGAFDKDMLKKFLADYAKMDKDKSKVPPQTAEYYDNLYKYWQFLEKTLLQNRLAEKYQALITKSVLSNPIEAKDSYEGRVNQSDMMMAGIPYSAIPDASIKVTDEEMKALYEKKKEQFKQYAESRDIKYIDVAVTASPEDKSALEKDVKESTTQLASTDKDYTTFIRSTGSTFPYVDLFYNKTAYPKDVVARLDSASMGQVYGPYYSMEDNTLNSFKLLGKTSAADSIEYRQIQVAAETQAKTKTLADSIYKALKGGANFEEIAKKYGQKGTTTWLTASQYEGAPVEGDNLKFLSTLNTMGQNEISNVPLTQGNLILQVTNKKAMKDKYKIAIIKRSVDFSKDTYNKAYNQFSQFLAANPSFDQMVVNAEKSGYKVQEQKDIFGSEHNVVGIKGTREAMKWIFTSKKGAVSGLYECGDKGDHMLVVSLTNIVKVGYRPFELVKDQLRAELIRDKKAEQLISKMKSVNASSIAQYKSIPGALTDTINHVTFDATAFVPSFRSSEPVVCAYAAAGKVNQLSAPLKGNAGVFVLQIVRQQRLPEQYNQQKEEATLMNMHARMTDRVMNDLYMKGKVKDTRYLFF